MEPKTIDDSKNKKNLPFEFTFQEHLFEAFATEKDNGMYLLHLENLVFYVKEPILVFRDQKKNWGAEQVHSKDTGFVKAAFDAFHKKYLS